MPLILTVGTAYGTGLDKFASEMLHLATVTQCIVCTEYEGMAVTVSAGQRVEDIANHLQERMERHRAFTSRPPSPRIR